MNEDARRARDAIVAGLADRRVAFMFGAGISIGRRSNCPGWQEMVEEAITQLAPGELRPHVPALIGPHVGLLFNEAFFQITDDVVGRQAAAGALAACFGTKKFSAIHRFAAWSAYRFDATVLTTNMDELIEIAGIGVVRHPRLLKLHGTVSDPDSARFTANSVFGPLDEHMLKDVRSMVSNRLLVVAGYGGMDEHDVMPALFDATLGHKVIWIWHSKRSDTLPARFVDSIDVDEVTVDVDVLMKSVFDELREQGGADELLDEWGEAPERAPDPSWWRGNLESWATGIDQSKPNERKMLWAKFADHLRIYLVSLEGDQRNIALEAYQAILNGPDATALERLTAEARIAYIRRTTKHEHFTSDEFGAIAGKLASEIASSEPSGLEALGTLLSWVIHQHAVALQGEKRFVLAKARFEDAINRRKSCNDPELPYSVFGHFMNAFQAAQGNIALLDELAEDGWRDTLAPSLDAWAEGFREDRRAEHFANTAHNAAFVYQALGEELVVGEAWAAAIPVLRDAVDRNDAAKTFRERLRDPRMIAQSLTRIAQCEVNIARCMLELHGSSDEVQQLIDDAAANADAARDIYDTVPQQQIRLNDVKGVLDKVEELRKVL